MFRTFNLCHFCSFWLSVYLNSFVLPSTLNHGFSVNTNLRSYIYIFLESILPTFCVHTKVLHLAFLHLHFRFVLFMRKNIGTKAALKMFVKLTTLIVYFSFSFSLTKFHMTSLLQFFYFLDMFFAALTVSFSLRRLLRKGADDKPIVDLSHGWLKAAVADAAPSLSLSLSHTHTHSSLSLTLTHVQHTHVCIDG